MNLSLPKATDHYRWADDWLTAEPLLMDKVRQIMEADQAVSERALLVEVMRFLHLVAYHRQTLTPSRLVDLAWHECILFTRYYAQFCDQHFGRFIHHSPGGKSSANQRNFARTIRYYGQAWGVPPAWAWGDYAVGLYREEQQVAADCGSCISDPIIEAP